MTVHQPVDDNDDVPVMRVIHFKEAHCCPNCGAVCLSCIRTDEVRDA